MGFLGWIRDRNAAQQQSVANKSQEPRPENAKQMYAREAEQEKTAAKPITAEIKTQADRALATINKASQHAQPGPSQAPADNAGSPEAHLQKQHGQSRAQEALSPTDSAAGQTATQGKDKTPDAMPSRAPQTVLRLRPSWCVCQLDLAHFDALIWPPVSSFLLGLNPVIS